MTCCTSGLMPCRPRLRLNQLTELFTVGAKWRIDPFGSWWGGLLLSRLTAFRLGEKFSTGRKSPPRTPAASRRLRNSLPPSTVTGRWGHEDFIAMLYMPLLECNGCGEIDLRSIVRIFIPADGRGKRVRFRRFRSVWRVWIAT